MKTKKFNSSELAAIYKISPNNLRTMSAKGVDIHDAREVVKDIKASSRKPESWAEFFTNPDDDSHEYWKLCKTREEVERLRLMNAKASGEMFDRADGERVQNAWASALNLALAERQATAPQLLAGKDEAWIADWIEDENRKLLEQLSDLESGLWEQVYDNYADNEGTPTDEAEGEQPKAKAKANRKRMVRRERQSGSGVNAEA